MVDQYVSIKKLIKLLTLYILSLTDLPLFYISDKGSRRVKFNNYYYRYINESKTSRNWLCVLHKTKQFQCKGTIFTHVKTHTVRIGKDHNHNVLQYTEKHKPCYYNI